MLSYSLTQQAEEDMKAIAIARYTLKQWGKVQSMRYAGKMERCFREIAAGSAWQQIAVRILTLQYKS